MSQAHFLIQLVQGMGEALMKLRRRPQLTVQSLVRCLHINECSPGFVQLGLKPLGLFRFRAQLLHRLLVGLGQKGHFLFLEINLPTQQLRLESKLIFGFSERLHLGRACIKFTFEQAQLLVDSGNSLVKSLRIQYHFPFYSP
ncbi:MAG TPA: hypothetical protein V6C99_09460 [Oculatellaceae cyanobacterium]